MKTQGDKLLDILLKVSTLDMDVETAQKRITKLFNPISKSEREMHRVGKEIGGMSEEEIDKCSKWIDSLLNQRKKSNSSQNPKYLKDN